MFKHRLTFPTIFVKPYLHIMKVWVARQPVYCSSSSDADLYKLQVLLQCYNPYSRKMYCYLHYSNSYPPFYT